MIEKSARKTCGRHPELGFCRQKIKDVASLFIPRRGFAGLLRGDFSTAAYNTKMNTARLFVCDTCNECWHGGQGSLRCRSENAPVDLRVILIGDLFANVSPTYLPLIFSTCDRLEMRYYQDDIAQHCFDFSPGIMIVTIHAADNMSETFQIF